MNREVIDSIIKATIGIDKFDLVDRTHRHTPWREQEENIIAGVRMLKYSNQEIQEYFSQNENELL